MYSSQVVACDSSPKILGLDLNDKQSPEGVIYFIFFLPGCRTRGPGSRGQE